MRGSTEQPIRSRGTPDRLGRVTEPPPIVPGDPTPPYGQQPYVPPPQPPPPQPVYYQPGAPPPEWQPARAAGNTVVVVLTILGIFVGLPLLCCLGWLVFGGLAGAIGGGR